MCCRNIVFILVYKIYCGNCYVINNNGIINEFNFKFLILEYLGYNFPYKLEYNN